MPSVFDHPWLGGLFGDAEARAIWSPETDLRRLLAVEAAWSRALGAAGRVGAEAAEAAARAIEAAEIDVADLATGTGRDGVAVPALVRQLRAASPAPEAVHTGATSQDVLDTALALALRETTSLLDARLAALADGLDALSAREGETPMMGRTRMQAAMPIRAADRIAPWRLPLAEHRARFARLRPLVERAQTGGAAGDGQALGPDAAAVAGAFADALDLAAPPRAWHAMRDGLADYASTLSLVTGTLGKMGQDLSLMAQQGIDEVAFASGGGSSAMPHKRNPVLPELLVSLARFNSVQVAGMHHALVHEQERSGAAWALEWMILPQMAAATARALAAARETISGIERIGVTTDDAR